MDNYFLLRNNKKSGPYNLEDLINEGLKPYDLVWVEGKSAAWRYPSELETLKDHAPVTEEQPFDRFYKKTLEELSSAIPSDKSREPPLHSKISTPKKTVFIELPANYTGTKPKNELTKIEQSTKVDQQDIKLTPVISDDNLIEQKYSESLDDIKKRYTEVYLNRKKQKSWMPRITPVFQVVGGALFFCLLVVLVYKNFATDDITEKNRRIVAIQPKPNISQTSENNEKFSISENGNNETQQMITLNEQSKENSINKERAHQVKPQTTQPITSVKEDEPESINHTEPKAILKKKSNVKTENDTEKLDTREPAPSQKNLNKLVKIRANKYKQRAFGGILNLELTVNNTSDFKLDKVLVELNYLKPSEQPLKTEFIEFNNIAPNASKTLKIPDYLRGVKLSYNIKEISSGDFNSYTAGL